MRNIIITLLVTLVGTSTVWSQYQIGLIPRESPDKGMYQKIGYTDVEIKYGSPKVNNRKIWGELVPYDVVWRAGSNNATTIEFGQDVFIEGNKLPKGKYAFFIIPKEGEKWVGVFSKNEKQWGAFKYNKEEDALRIELLPKPSEYNEELEYEIEQYGYNSGTIRVAWERLKVEIEIDTDYQSIFKSGIENKLTTVPPNIKWVLYVQGAEYLYKTDGDLVKAFEWINKGEALIQEDGEWNKQFYPKKYIQGHLYWTKAKILAKKGEYTQALDYAEKMIGIENEYNYYDKKKEAEKMETMIESWKNM